jgi:hypothetical protein
MPCHTSPGLGICGVETMSSSDAIAELRVLPARELADQPPAEDAPPPLAAARKAVPLLWLGLFDFEECEVRPGERGELFLAVTPVAQALARAETLARALPEKEPALAPQARLLAGELRKRSPGHFLALYPTEIFASLRPELGRLYLQRLFGICEVWEKIRQGLGWPEARKLFDRLGPDLGNALAEEPRLLSYYLLGNLAEQYDPLEQARVREGQAQRDQEPEALAAGEHGLLLGRFAGRWKLMSSGTDQDLTAIWGEGGTTFLVGRRGTVLRLRRGGCTSM